MSLVQSPILATLKRRPGSDSLSSGFVLPPCLQQSFSFLFLLIVHLDLFHQLRSQGFYICHISFLNIMWPPAGVLLALVGLTSASVFLYDPSPSETDGKPYDTSFSNNVGENPNIFSNVESSNGDPNTALPAEETYQNADALLAGTNSNLPISDDGAYQPDAVAPIGGCNAPTSSRTRSKRFDEQCPAETEEQKPVCEIELYPQALCCLGPHLSGYIIVNRCKPCRWL